MNRFLMSLSLVLAFAVCTIAQTTTGRLSGTISGPDGVLAGATVTATSNETGRELTAIANGDGSYLFPQIEFGTYTVKVTAAGFKAYVANQVKIDVGRDYSLSPTLEIGSVQETVTVTAGADVVTSTTSQISNTVSPQQILSLPLIARNPLDLTRLQSGVQSNQFQNTTINGVRTSFTNITRDGINIQDSFIRTNATDFAPGRPSVDDTAEFTVTTSNQEADQGSGSAQIRLVTPRGGKNFSGALFAYNRNSKFAANNFFSNRAGQARPFRNRNQFGGKISGPMPVPGFGEGGPQFLKDKGFFFFAYEKIIDPLSAGATRTILTPTARNNIFQYTRATPGAAINTTLGTSTIACPATTVANTGTCVITDFLGFARASNLPLTSGVGGNPIPATVSPIIQSRIINRIPATGNTTAIGDNLNTTGYFVNRKSNSTRDTYTTRLDVDFNENNSINGVFSYNKETNLRPDVDTNGYDPDPQADQLAKNKTFSLAYRHIFSSNVVNEIRGGSFFSDVPFRRLSATPEYMLTVPLITSPETNFTDQGRSPRYWTLQDNVDWIVGSHNFRFGGQLQNYKIKSYNFGNGIPTTTPGFLIQTNAGTTPVFAAGNFTTLGGISSAQVGTANGLLGLLGGIIAQGQLRYNLPNGQSQNFEVGPNIQPYLYSNHALYVSDRWQIRNNLTLTAGVRYELYPALKLENNLGVEPVITDPNNYQASLLDRNGTYNILGTNSGELGTYFKTDFNNFAPTIGIAWQPNIDAPILKHFLGKGVVIRGGWGRSFGNDQLVTAMNNAIGQNIGLASRTGFVVGSNGSTLLNLRLGVDPIPQFTAPVLVPPPFTFIRNNSNTISATANFGTVFAVAPKLQTPSVDQISFGYQKEFWGNTALEVRYVGTRSDNFVRGVDLNQIDIFSNGFAADVNRAIANTALTGNPFCTTAQNAACQALSILVPSGTVLLPNNTTQTFATATPTAGRLIVGTNGMPAATFNTNIQNATPGQLALAFIQGNGCASWNNHPSIVSATCPAGNPNATPFINFVPNPGTGAVDVMINDGGFRYHSLQLELRRRFAKGLYFQANYTFSKNLTNAIGSANSPASGQSLFEPYLDNNNKQWDYSRADFDQTHVFNFNGVYQLPFGKGKWLLNNGGVIDQIFGGWEMSGIVQWSSGGPITFTDTRGTLNYGGRSGRQTPNSNLSYDQIRALMGTFEANGNIYWINPSIINTATGTASNGYIMPGLNQNTTFTGQSFFNVDPGKTGNLGRFLVNGPKFFNINAAMLKNFKLNENGMRIQLRAETFNMLNNVNFNANAQLANINSTSFGRVTSAAAARTVQFAARFEF